MLFVVEVKPLVPLRSMPAPLKNSEEHVLAHPAEVTENCVRRLQEDETDNPAASRPAIQHIHDGKKAKRMSPFTWTIVISLLLQGPGCKPVVNLPACSLRYNLTRTRTTLPTRRIAQAEIHQWHASDDEALSKGISRSKAESARNQYRTTTGLWQIFEKCN